jgi:hypothetical protein
VNNLRHIQAVAIAVAVCLNMVVVDANHEARVNPHLEEDFIVITEYIEGSNSIKSADIISKDIGVLGFWDVEQDPIVTISFTAADNLAENKDLLLNYSRQAIFSAEIDHAAANDTTNGNNSQRQPSWLNVLGELSHYYGKQLPLLVELPVANGTTTSDIRVFLTADAHSAGRNGQATVTLDSEGYILSVEIIIFRADVLYSEKYLAHVLKHEMGHALGLSHANYMESVMFPSIVDVNGSVLGAITDCEEKALGSLYMQSSKEVVSCD